MTTPAAPPRSRPLTRAPPPPLAGGSHEDPRKPPPPPHPPKARLPWTNWGGEVCEYREDGGAWRVCGRARKREIGLGSPPPSSPGSLDHQDRRGRPAYHRAVHPTLDGAACDEIATTHRRHRVPQVFQPFRTHQKGQEAWVLTHLPNRTGILVQWASRPPLRPPPSRPEGASKDPPILPPGTSECPAHLFHSPDWVGWVVWVGFGGSKLADLRRRPPPHPPQSSSSSSSPRLLARSPVHL